ncbi:hypothetical protein DMH04_44540 [Kibdelosporangium aridum]|uniref:Uncharacterized protein n=1 Tax=Kibdelosporangium aridum TaxID=2030 RepID=A0A428YQ53_KIBAR|nr:hypothetical protein [Kibdelosporangium aridum]RSM70681.1 hypothetical protein DMH04_44540 [Kibdelosporangium aridum]
MAVLQWIAVALCVVQGSYMLIDGIRALTTGSYITPSSGDHAGQLGPWARIVERAGIAPESAAMKWTFVILGLAWLTVAVGLGLATTWSWIVALVVAIASLWYLIPGTVISVIVLVLLVVTPLRSIG